MWDWGEVAPFAKCQPSPGEAMTSKKAKMVLNLNLKSRKQKVLTCSLHTDESALFSVTCKNRASFVSTQAYSVLPLHSSEKLPSKEYKMAWESKNNVHGFAVSY